MKTLVLFLFLPTVAWADDSWLCTETSSLHVSEKLYTACGVGEASNLSTARLNAFKAAKSEFREYCDQSFSCKNREVDLHIKRTDCRDTKQGYICYRAVDFNVLNRSIQPITEAEYNQQIKTKESELKKLYVQLENTQKLRERDSEVDKLKNLLTEYEQTQEGKLLEEAEKIRTRSHRQVHLNLVFKAGWVYNTKTVETSYDYDLIGLQASIEKNFTSWLALSIGGEGLSKSEQSDDTGINSKPRVDSSAFTLSAPISVYSDIDKRIFILPEYGSRSSELSSGTKLHQSFYGSQVGLDYWGNWENSVWGLSLSVGYRKYGDSGSFKGKLSVMGFLGLMVGI